MLWMRGCNFQISGTARGSGKTVRMNRFLTKCISQWVSNASSNHLTMVGNIVLAQGCFPGAWDDIYSSSLWGTESKLWKLGTNTWYERVDQQREEISERAICCSHKCWATNTIELYFKKFVQRMWRWKKSDSKLSSHSVNVCISFNISYFNLNTK